jgi:hypothetical protein
LLELADYDHRNFQFLGQRLDAVGNVSNFLLPVFCSPRSRMEQLQVVNDKEFDARVRSSEGRGRLCVLGWSLRERTERGVYAASAWCNTCDVSVLLERLESAEGEAA